MPVSIEVPDDIHAALESRWGDLSLHVRESLAVEGYRQQVLSLAQVRRLLGLATRWEAQVFLGQHGVEVFDFDPAELDREAVLQERVMSRPSVSPE